MDGTVTHGIKGSNTTASEKQMPYFLSHEESRFTYILLMCIYTYVACGKKSPLKKKMQCNRMGEWKKVMGYI